MGANSTQAGGVTVFLLAFVLIAYGLADGGVIIHEVGTVRMGSQPATSALNQYCQAHDVKNLFVTDGASFVTNADKNPTLTIMSLAVRSCDYLMSELKRNAAL